MKLRDYQSECVAANMESFGENSRVLNVLPTGTGKTVMFAHVIKQMAAANGKRALVLAHREELLRQASDKIERVTGNRPDMEMAEFWADQPSLMHSTPADVIVSTVQTLTSGGGGDGRMARFSPDDFGLVVIDEAHHAVAQTYRRVIEHFSQNPDCKILGVTATPDRTDEAAMGRVFEDVPYDMEISHAINGGWLVPIHARQVQIEGLDFSSVRTTAGDLNGADLDRIMRDEQTLHRMAEPTIEIAGDRRTLLFSTTCAMAERLCEILNRHKDGCARYLDGKTPRDERREMLTAYSAGEFQFLSNVGVATEGFDVPGIELVVPRPTKSRSLYAQMIGRATRPLDGLVDPFPTAEQRRDAIENSQKPHMEIIDFTGISGRHKLIHGPDVLGGKFDDDVVDLAKKMMAEETEAVDIEDALALAQERREQIEQRRLEQQAEADKRRSVKARVKYTTTRMDVFDFLHITPSRQRDWAGAKPLSEKQLNMLKRQGIDVGAYNNRELKEILVKLFSRITSNACSMKQAKVLQRANWYEDGLSFSEASNRIGQLTRNKWRKPTLEGAMR